MISLQYSHLLWWTNGSLDYSRTRKWTTQSTMRWVISACGWHHTKQSKYTRHLWNINLKMHQIQSQNPEEHIFLTLTILIFSASFDFTFQNDVKSPKSTRHSCTVTWSHSGGQDEIKTVELVIETTPANIDWSPMEKSNSGNCFIYSFVDVKVPKQQFSLPEK